MVYDTDFCHFFGRFDFLAGEDLQFLVRWSNVPGVGWEDDTALFLHGTFFWNAVYGAGYVWGNAEIDGIDDYGVYDANVSAACVCNNYAFYFEEWSGKSVVGVLFDWWIRFRDLWRVLSVAGDEVFADAEDGGGSDVEAIKGEKK